MRCVKSCFREVEEKRQAAWDEEEERIAAELAEKAAALVAREKLKVAWEQEERKIAEEIDVLKAAANAELKRREAWEIEEVKSVAQLFHVFNDENLEDCRLVSVENSASVRSGNDSIDRIFLPAGESGGGDGQHGGW
jgi:hypothetical protein